MRTHRGGGGEDLELVAPGTEDRPLVGAAEQAVGRLSHVDEVVDARADAAHHAHDGLQEDGRLHQSEVEVVRERVQVADVVRLELEAGARLRADDVQHVLDVGVRADERRASFHRRGGQLTHAG